MPDYGKQGKKIITVNVISDKTTLACHLLVPHPLSLSPHFLVKLPSCTFTLSLLQPQLFEFLLQPKGSCLRFHQSILSLLSRKRQLNKALLLICTCDLQLACFLINLLFVRAIIRHFVCIASGVINSNTAFYAKI